MIKKLKISAKTDVGRRRDHNEDDLKVIWSDMREVAFNSFKTGFHVIDVESIPGKNSNYLILADGMGGENAGEVASQLAIKEMEVCIHNVTLPFIPSLDWLSNSISLINKQIYTYSQDNPDTKGMGTTIVVGALVSDGNFLVSWVGDSRAYLYRQGEGLSVLTKDHSVVQELVDKGKINEDMAFFHPDKNIITQSLGDKEPVKPGSKLIEVFDGDRILLCSDGLNDMLQDHEIEEILSNIDDTDECAKLLVNKANEAGGNDNITVILCDVESSKINTAKAIEKLKTADTLPVATYKTNDSFTRDNYNNLKVKVRNRNIILSILLLLVVSIGGYFGYEQFTKPKTPTTNTDSTKVENDSTENKPIENVVNDADFKQIGTNNNLVNSLPTTENVKTNLASNDISNEIKNSQLVNNDPIIYYIKLIGLKDNIDICDRYKAIKDNVSNLVLFKEGDIYVLASGPMKLDEAKTYLVEINSKMKTILNKPIPEDNIFKKNNFKNININNFCDSVTKANRSNPSESNLTKVQNFQVFITVEPGKADSLLKLIIVDYPKAKLNSDSTKIIIKEGLTKVDAENFNKIIDREVQPEEMQK